MIKKKNKEYSSFRDPAGYVYYENDLVYRRVNKCYFKEYDHLINSGLYQELLDNSYIVSQKEIYRCEDYILLEVEKIPFISYPYEWCYEEIKDASILTLKIEQLSLKYGMTLKDASGYNVQFLNGKPIFIDILSFMFYKDGSPWMAYGQFCRHFLCPLVLMRYVDERLNSLLINYIDGIPLDIASNILGKRGGLVSLEHIKLHNKSIINNNNNLNNKKYNLSKSSILNIIAMLERQINNLKRKKSISEWDNYYDNTNYDAIADKSKHIIINKYLKEIKCKNNDTIWDLGSNDGKYSYIASKYVNNVISFDIDYNTVNRNYINIKNNNKNILPLLLDLTNPSPAIGFASLERKSVTDRGGCKCILALAIIHHIAISNNVSFDKIAEWFSKLGKYLIIEFVPKNDSQVEKLLKTRNDIFDWYNIDNFEELFSSYYKIISNSKIKNSKRVIYLMESNYEK